MQNTNTKTANRYKHDDGRWQAVVTRDHAADGAFYYGVQSTRIFCRPTCPSRKPTRERVRFYETVQEAIREGYRPCKRCRPMATSSDAEFVTQIVDTIESRDSGSPTLSELSSVVGMSPGHLQRKFKQLTGVSPAQYARHRRAERLRAKLKDGPDVTTSMYDAGFESSASMYESIDRELGMTPTAYKGGAHDQIVHYVIGQSPLGMLLLAYTARGVASVRIAERSEELLDGLREEFPNANLHVDDSGHPWFQAVLDYLAGDIPHPDLPVDVRGTAFQRRVWQAIQVIPPGETRTYADLAEEIGNRDAVRAVANACATNRVALIIPCHRVVRSDGTPGGYRWGVDRKEALLEMEKGAMAS